MPQLDILGDIEASGVLAHDQRQMSIAVGAATTVALLYHPHDARTHRHWLTGCFVFVTGVRQIEDKVATDPRFLHIYCDESRHMAHRYMVLGGLILDRRYEPTFNQSFANYCTQNRMHSELKWSKVSAGKLQEYKSLLDLVVSCNQSMHFKALVVDTHQMNLRRFNKNNRDDAINRLLYQFLVHMFGRYLNPTDECIVTLDQRNTNQKLSKLCAISNNGLRRKHSFSHYPIREIKAADSKKCSYIQIADVLMGAIGFQVNGDCNKPGASPAKCELMNHILTQWRLRDFLRSTSSSKRDFSIWHFQYSNK